MIWVFTGPICDQFLHAFAPHRAIPMPNRLSWREREKDDSVSSAAWIIPNVAADKQVGLDKLLVPETATGVKLGR